MNTAFHFRVILAMNSHLLNPAWFAITRTGRLLPRFNPVALAGDEN